MVPPGVRVTSYLVLQCIPGVWYKVKVPLRDVVGLKSRGCRKLQRGNTGVPMYVYERCEVRSCCAAATAAVVPLLLLLLYSCCRCCCTAAAAAVTPLLLLLLYCCRTARMLLKFRGSVGWNRPSLCSGWHAHMLRAHVHTDFKS